MKKVSTIFLQGVIVLIGMASLAFLLWEPHLEGRNVDATLFEIYFKDPFLAYAYIGAIPFFVALHQAFKLLGVARRNQMFSADAVKTLRTIKYCAVCLIGFVAVGEIIIMSSDSEDVAGGVFMGVLVIFGSVITVTAATVFERLLQNAVDLKSENDLTV